MLLRFKVSSLSERGMLTKEGTVDHVFVKLQPLDEPCGGDMDVVFKPTAKTYLPEKVWKDERSGLPSKVEYAANTKLESATGSVGGETFTFTEGAVVEVSLALAAAASA